MSTLGEKEHTMFDSNNPYNQSPQPDPYDASNQYNPNYFQGQYRQPDFSEPGNPPTRSRRWKGSSCLIGLLSLALMFGLFWLIFKLATSLHLETIPLFYSQEDNPFVSPQVWFIGGGLWVVGLIFVVAFQVLGINKNRTLQRPARKLISNVFAVTFFAFFITALIWSQLINPNIGMTRTSFLRTSVSITDDTSIHISNPADGVTQTLCSGIDQRCQPADGAPGQLNQGLVIQPGQIVTLTFTQDKTYQITSKTTPGMNLTVEVNAPSNDSGGD